MDFLDLALKVFELDEGRVDHPYRDSVGKYTIGIGHLIGDHLADLKLSQHIIDELFKEDLAIAIREARLVVGGIFFDGMVPARKIALVSMLYTLGRNKFLQFAETIDAMKREDWDEVANRILKAKWARDVDPKQRVGEGRDDRVAFMFATGEFHPDYNIKD